MNREKSLVKNTVILALGTYLPKLTTIITLPILTGYLTKAEYGSYDLITTLVSLLLPAMTLQIQSAAFRFLISSRDNEKEITSVVTNIFSFTVPVSCIGLLITYFALGDSIDPLTKKLILLYFFSDIIYIGCGQITRGIGRNAIYASGAVVVSVVNMIGIVLSMLVFQAGLNGIVIGMLAGCVIGSALMFVRVRIFHYFDFKEFSIAKVGELLAYSWPMVPNALSNWVLSLSDRLVIIKFLGIETNAIYAVANKIPNLVKTFQGTFVSAWQENASLSVEDVDAKKYYSKMLDSINNIVLGLTAGLIAFTPFLFSVLIRGDYDEAYQQMSILYIGMYFSCMSSFLGGIYIAHMKTKSVGLTTLAAACCNLFIDLTTVNYIGLYAASVSTMVSYALLFLFRIFDIRKFQEITVNYLKMGGYFGLIVLMSVLVYFNNFQLNILNMVIGVLFATIINRETLKILIIGVKKQIKNKKA